MWGEDSRGVEDAGMGSKRRGKPQKETRNVGPAVANRLISYYEDSRDRYQRDRIKIQSALEESYRLTVTEALRLM